jgi:hypothetical protein
MKPAFKAPEFLLLDQSMERRDSAFSSSRSRDQGGWAAFDGYRHSHDEPAGDDLVRENRFIQRMLDDRDRQYASLQGELSMMRRDWAWRTLGLLRFGVRRIRRQFWKAASADAEARRDHHPSAGRGSAA